jgi:hypothetical protein
VDDPAHWDCWGSLGDLHVNLPAPNSTPEAAMNSLLIKARLVFGEQDWAAWSWDAKEYATGTRQPRMVRFRYEGDAFIRLSFDARSDDGR